MRSRGAPHSPLQASAPSDWHSWQSQLVRLYDAIVHALTPTKVIGVDNQIAQVIRLGAHRSHSFNFFARCSASLNQSCECSGGGDHETTNPTIARRCVDGNSQGLSKIRPNLGTNQILC
jgi:hypothetical protein